MAHLHCLRVLRYASQFVTLLAAPTAFVRAATCVLHATSFISSFVPLHPTFTSAAFSPPAANNFIIPGSIRHKLVKENKNLPRIIIHLQMN
ncbi:MAG: hypothetical protein ACR2GN_08070 [Bacteroidia bacterium]